jgi:very-short-patch-repair endonuclease
MTYFHRINDRPDADFKPLSLCLADALDTAALARSLAPKCDSPIEIDLGVKINKVLRVIDDASLSLVPQYEMGPYRYDWAIVRDSKLDPLALVECDGKDFHSTVEQLENDRAKDRLASSRGVMLRRFTGSEIHRNPDLCIAGLLQDLRWMGQLTQQQCDKLDAAGIRRHRPTPDYGPY